MRGPAPLAEIALARKAAAEASASQLAASYPKHAAMWGGPPRLNPSNLRAHRLPTCVGFLVKSDMQGAHLSETARTIIATTSAWGFAQPELCRAANLS